MFLLSTKFSHSIENAETCQEEVFKDNWDLHKTICCEFSIEALFTNALLIQLKLL